MPAPTDRLTPQGGHLRLVSAGLAVILVGILATTAEVPAPPAAPLPVSIKCAECGVVASTREVGEPGAGDGHGPTETILRQEVTVRMKDGSIRVFMEATPGHWRAGERLILIEGAG